MKMAPPSAGAMVPLRSTAVREFLTTTFLQMAEKLLAVDRLRRLHRSVAGTEGLVPFLDASLQSLDLSWSVPEGDRDKIPGAGPLVVVANHPYGAAEGMVLARLLLSVRPDVKVLANCLLSQVGELRDLFLFVDPFDRDDSVSRNVKPLREAVRWVRQGGVLAVFPAGEVAHLNLRERAVVDPPWSPTVGRLVRMTRAPVLPVHFAGGNGVLFQLAGLVHPRLRTALLPRELLELARRNLALRVGAPLPFSDLDPLERDEDLARCLRFRTDLLGAAVIRRSTARSRRRRAHSRPRPLALPVSPAQLQAEVERLPVERGLCARGDYRVFWARAPEIPFLLAEIGRLREATFRTVGEGCGQARDLDRFDRTYLHLCLWNASTREPVGAYRMGQTDLRPARAGVRGLYTNTLFRYRPEFLAALGPSLELGRSFVRVEYQRSYLPLLLLWQGIGRFVARQPRYRMLFGPVSISTEYLGASRELMARTLTECLCAPELAQWARPRHPLRNREPRLETLARWGLLPRQVEELSHWVRDLEPDGKGVPVLLRQYLKLGAQVVGFNLDRRFGDVLDCLLAVDLCKAPRAILDRHLGVEDARSFLEFHGAVGASMQRCA
jgi:putative hemolysin